MSIRIICNSCGREYILKHEAAGQTFLCRSCNSRILVPFEEDQEILEAEIATADVIQEDDPDYPIHPILENGEATPYSGNELPKPVKVIGILSLVFGGFGIIGSLWNIFTYAKMIESLTIHFSVSSGYQTFLSFSYWFALILHIALITSGIALLKHQKWGKMLAVYLASFQIPWILLNLFLSWTHLVRPLMDLDLGDGVITGSAIGAVIGALLYLIFPVLTIIYLSNPQIKAFFEAGNDSQ